MRRPVRAVASAGALAAMLLAAGCRSAPTASDTRTAAVIASELPVEALPIGVPLPETRGRCILADGLIYTRIIRGTGVDAAPDMPCASPETQLLFGGGRESATSNAGPWVWHVLELDPAVFRGQLKPVLSNDTIAGKETPSAMGARHGAIAAINVGFFIVGTSGDEITAEGLTGDPSGLMALDGTLISEAVNTRVGMVWTRGEPLSMRFPSLTDALEISTSGGQTLAIDGINRPPGTIRNCGGTGGDTPTEKPRQGKVCSDPDEIIWFQPIYGTATPPGEGIEAILDDSGIVTALRSRGGAIPARGTVVAATGTEGARLTAALGVGQRATLVERLTADGAPFERRADTIIMTGGPELVRDGQASLQDKRDGFDPDDDPTYRASFVSGQNPRTLAAVTAAGRILLIVVDGRQNAWSAGLPLEDAIPVLLFFGADRAVNLDGGGSSAMAINGRLVNKPSDGSERPVSDALLLMP